MCRPPAKTEDNTLHVLSACTGEKTFLWLNEKWNTPGTNFGTKPSMMSVLGWSYGRALDRANT